MFARSIVIVLALLSSAAAFLPAQKITRAPVRLAAESSRRGFLAESVAVAGVALAAPAFADDAAPAAPPKPEKVNYGDFPVPSEWGISGKDYYADATRVVKHMEYATQQDKGAANMDEINKNMKKEMVDFVSFYRRFNNVAGKQSFSTLYTAINVLAGHYTSYGTKFPVPEKRRKRLYQEYAEIEKNIKKGR
mmetsp:Transcript_11350/g.26667  ORF Transcript_11350/g.26667 Transcript_11350/m.26667 type:complete len:192 (+) Transcript_11350:55-630(+)|eukprot:CAMPEP_0172586260 /NCGR_PEP_ID=MMETSP1068-20121228/5632_1 /TAXON_ID=35684 /ORGANISM="Pseudopedinella elastica, Strain CCMP716" /LENGTH=191 /DNA_ID=CAMNT_0013380999 /DNA_START=55 /DNA_END=630 /DNA_ORIENTATION=-